MLFLSCSIVTNFRSNRRVVPISDTQNHRPKILIADDSEMNRAILADMLGDSYEVIEAENGLEAVAAMQTYSVELSLVLLDIVMPEMDGFGVLDAMNKHRWIDDIPVIMISAESAPAVIERAYELGVTDFISRPFDAMIVQRRVTNTILLYAKQKKLVGLVADQIYEKEQNNSLMIDILSHIVGFKNGESAQHVLHVRSLTELLLDALTRRTDRYRLTWSDISAISMASALHDVGKLGIPSEILNKPGKLTDEEFAVMKTHAAIGAEMLQDLPVYQNEPLVRSAYEICRWHHERYDGRGYPDGLKGDEIPISAQIVALADVYDALTSERVYKPPFSHEEAVAMILNGECGVFNPLLMDCLRDISDTLKNAPGGQVPPHTGTDREHRGMIEQMARHKELTVSERTLRLLEQERMKNNFYAALTHEIQFDYTAEPAMVSISAWGAQRLGLDEIIMDPLKNPAVRGVMDPKDLKKLMKKLRRATPEQPLAQQDCVVTCGKERRWFRVVVRAMWSAESNPQFTGCIGKAMDIHDSRMMLNDLERKASHDPLTGLYNHAHAKTIIQQRMDDRPDSQFALVMIDLDHFKGANDTYGHQFGDQVLTYLSERLRQSIRGSDIAVRVGGDEFLIFLEYKRKLEPIIQRIFNALCGQVDEFPLSVSMGISRVSGADICYEDLFRQADQALYRAKQAGRGQYCFYDDSMKDTLSTVSPIESEQNPSGPAPGKRDEP